MDRTESGRRQFCHPLLPLALHNPAQPSPPHHTAQRTSHEESEAAKHFEDVVVPLQQRVVHVGGDCKPWHSMQVTIDREDGGLAGMAMRHPHDRRATVHVKASACLCVEGDSQAVIIKAHHPVARAARITLAIGYCSSRQRWRGWGLFAWGCMPDAASPLLWRLDGMPPARPPSRPPACPSRKTALLTPPHRPPHPSSPEPRMQNTALDAM